jgi:hypothetical protein
MVAALAVGPAAGAPVVALALLVLDGGTTRSTQRRAAAC